MSAECAMDEARLKEIIVEQGYRIRYQRHYHYSSQSHGDPLSIYVYAVLRGSDERQRYIGRSKDLQALGEEALVGLIKAKMATILVTK